MASIERVGLLDADGTATVDPASETTLAKLVRRGSTSAESTASVNDTVGGTTLQAANANRLSLYLCNMDATSVVYVAYGAPTATAYIIHLDPQETVIIDDWAGVVKGICASGETADVRVTEVTA